MLRRGGHHQYELFDASYHENDDKYEQFTHKYDL